ncbi:MAG: DUF2934 domain-containing protein [Chthoniobacterales bacterium]
MPKNSKNESANGNIAHPEAPAGAIAPVQSPAKKSTKAAKKPARKVAAKKPAAKSPAKRASASKRAAAAKSPAPSDADIRLRAYFIAEFRAQQGLPGDPANDWLEAVRQLRAEADLA